MLLFVFFQIRYNLNKSVPQVGNKRFDFFRIISKSLYIKYFARFKRDSLLQFFIIRYMFDLIDRNFTDFIRFPLRNQIAHIGTIVIKVNAYKRLIDFCIQISILHIVIANTQIIVFEVFETHFPVITTPKPTHKLFLFICNNIIKVIRV